MSRQTQTLAATTGAVAWDIYRADEFNVPRIDLTFSVAPTSSGYLYIKKDSGQGAAFDSIIRVFDVIGLESVSIEGMQGLANGDKLVIEYANPDGVTVTGSATVDIPLLADTHVAGMTISDGTIRSKTSKYRHWVNIELASSNPGGSGATYESPTANYLGGERLNLPTDVLETEVNVREEWDSSTDPHLEATVTNMIDNTLGDPADIIKFKFVAYYSQSSVPGAPRTQTFYAQGTVGQLAQYAVLRFDLEIDRNAVDNPIYPGDIMYLAMNFEADSDIDDMIINHAAFWYKTTHVGDEVVE